MMMAALAARRLRQENEIERLKFMTGYVMAELWNSAGKTLKKGVRISPMDFWVNNDDTQADEVDILVLMNSPEARYRFKKDG